MDQACWQFLGQHNFLTPDLAGHGDARRSGPPPASLGELADDLAGRLPERFHLAGVALGGCIALYLALQHPDSVASMLVINSTARSDRDTMLARAEEVRAHGLAAVLPKTFQRWFSPEGLATPEHPGIAYARDRFLGADSEVYAACWSGMARHDTTDRLHRLRIPVTVIGSHGDASVSLEKARFLAEHVPGARYRELRGPHMIHLEEPLAVRTAITEHLAFAGQHMVVR